jgi:thiosulfate dehydrogenase [quinone] large subunit
LGLILIGLGLFFGCFTRASSIAGMVLLFLYYVANPPFIGLNFGVPTEGNYLVVDKNMVELLALAVVAIFPASSFLGLDRLMLIAKEKRGKVILSKEQIALGWHRDK